MKVTKESIENFTVEFESEEELRHEFEANLSAGGLFLSSTERPAEMSTIQLNLRLTEGGSFATSATVVRLRIELPNCYLRHTSDSLQKELKSMLPRPGGLDLTYWALGEVLALQFASPIEPPPTSANA